MSSLKIPLALSVIAIALIAACCCSGLGGLGGLLGGVEFTTGEFADVPSYPNSTQTTDSVSGLEGMMAVFKFIPGEAEWKHYTTTDSEDDVLAWYADELPSQGWQEASSEDMETSYENSAFYAKSVGDTEVMLFVLVLPDVDDSGHNHIIIGRIELDIETEE
ncbi:MAG: hypothetical protein JXA14_13980 [Anaerolineae bacterium]|nr:hypothetical protein [Anaerolineae bacterium]